MPTLAALRSTENSRKPFARITFCSLPFVFCLLVSPSSGLACFPFVTGLWRFHERSFWRV